MDVEALQGALKEGVIDCIASDHAPHAYDEKEAAFDDAPFGIVGLETAFGVAYTELVQGGALTLPQLILRMSTVPAQVLDRKSTRLNSSHSQISYAVFCLKKKKTSGENSSNFEAEFPLGPFYPLTDSELAAPPSLDHISCLLRTAIRQRQATPLRLYRLS